MRYTTCASGWPQLFRKVDGDGSGQISFFEFVKLMREEARQDAEALLGQLSIRVAELYGQIPIIYVREGSTTDELLNLIDEEPSISVLVLGANTQGESPGPLVTYMTGKGAARMRVPITIVPGNLTEEQIDAIT